ncbi:MAG TPA: methyl-accepting chemotaxis protein [Bacillota bacterium]|nr:methyl-accepting chemotaxis protein [Bacillota bacterium]
MGIAGKLTSIVITLLLIVSLAVASIGYKVAHKQIEDAAGIELDGCANITTGLVLAGDIEDLKNGNLQNLNKVENQINWTVDHKAIFKNASIMTVDGKLLAVDKRLKQQGFKAGDTFYIDKKAVDEVKTMKHSAYSELYQFGGFERKTGYAPIFKDHDPNKEMIALMAIDFDASIITNRTYQILLLPFVAGTIVTILAMIIAYFIIQRMVRPIISVSAQVKEIASGNLTVKPLNIQSKDEVGYLASDMNLMVSRLRQLIGQIMESSEQTAATSEQLSASAEITGESSTQISISINDVADGATKQADRANQIVSMMDAAVEEIDEGGRLASKTTQNAVESTEVSKQGEKSIQEAITHLEFVNKTVSFATESIQKLGQRSEEISGIITIITDISNQTNLLALNAAIEAARAGEQGRGFAVVADEVRKLAEQSKQAAEQITELIRDIQAETSVTVRTMESNQEAVHNQVTMIQQGGEALKSIVKKVENTEMSVEQIQKTFESVRSHVLGVMNAIKEISDIIEQSASVAQEVAATTEEQTASVQEISASSTELAILAEKLQSEVKQFRIS